MALQRHVIDATLEQNMLHANYAFGLDNGSVTLTKRSAPRARASVAAER